MSTHYCDPTVIAQHYTTLNNNGTQQSGLAIFSALSLHSRVLLCQPHPESCLKREPPSGSTQETLECSRQTSVMLHGSGRHKRLAFPYQQKQHHQLALALCHFRSWKQGNAGHSTRDLIMTLSLRRLFPLVLFFDVMPRKKS